MSSLTQPGRVLVTGATGYVAMHCIVQLLEAGWQVRGTVRDLARADGLRRIIGRQVDADRLDVVAATLDDDRGWAAAVAGCRYVLHVASPVLAARPKHADDIIKPARDGTLRVLRAAAAAEVERVVMTSSLATVLYGHPRDGSKTFDERDWTRLGDDVAPYEQSKTLAERAAWDFIESLPVPRTLELVTMLPGLILGPVLDADFSVSGEAVKKLLARELPAVPDVGWSMVDVRDVADAHLRAMTTPAAAGQRFVLGGPHTWWRDVACILAAHADPLGFRVPTRRLPTWIVRLVARFDRTVALVVPELGLRQDVSNARAREVLGWQPRSVDRMVIDMADSMIALGVVTARRRPRKALTDPTPGIRSGSPP